MILEAASTLFALHFSLVYHQKGQFRGGYLRSHPFCPIHRFSCKANVQPRLLFRRKCEVTSRPSASTPSSPGILAFFLNVARCAKADTYRLCFSSKPLISTKDSLFRAVNTCGGISSTGSHHLLFWTGFLVQKISKLWPMDPRPACRRRALLLEHPLSQRRIDAQNGVDDVSVFHSRSSALSAGDPTSPTPRQAEKTRRNILTFMVEPFSRSIKSLKKNTKHGTSCNDSGGRIPPRLAGTCEAILCFS
ncbi:hypothetical protein EDB19DRAFT_1747262 [Suillus lakei]|nr:hypothetical protein EDB19DRAFT_1747262 [Suillus lakei]